MEPYQETKIDAIFFGKKDALFIEKICHTLLAPNTLKVGINLLSSSRISIYLVKRKNKVSM